MVDKHTRHPVGVKTFPSDPPPCKKCIIWFSQLFFGQKLDILDSICVSRHMPGWL